MGRGKGEKAYAGLSLNKNRGMNEIYKPQSDNLPYDLREWCSQLWEEVSWMQKVMKKNRGKHGFPLNYTTSPIGYEAGAVTSIGTALTCG
jgi:hypothetical protein